jgi:hypothetical protein
MVVKPVPHDVLGIAVFGGSRPVPVKLAMLGWQSVKTTDGVPFGVVCYSRHVDLCCGKSLGTITNCWWPS